MSSVRVGAALAVLVAGPPLYALVQSGDMDPSTAFERGGVVLIGCAIGASMIFRMIETYSRDEQVTHARRAAQIEQVLTGLVPDEPSKPVVSRPSRALESTPSQASIKQASIKQGAIKPGVVKPAETTPGKSRTGTA